MSRDDISPGRRTVAAAFAALMILGATVPGWAQSSVKIGQYNYNLDKDGLLLRGYDPVAYFSSGVPTKGLEQFVATHGGATLRFASAEHRDAFLREPDKYLPAYGGFCAYGVASGYKVDGDPTVWKIVDDRLYVNIDAGIGEKFNAGAVRYIRRANARWPAMKDKSPDQVNN